MNGWRAVLRLAARDARRGRGRSALLAAMVLVPVMLATVGAVTARSASRDPQDVVQARLGTGQIQARVHGMFDGNRVEQDLTADATGGSDVGRPLAPAEVEQRLRGIVGPRNRLVPLSYGGGRAVAVGDGVVRVDVGELDVPALGAGSPVTLASGRAPAADDEVLAWDRGTGPVLPVGARFRVVAAPGAPEPGFTVVGTFRATDSLGLADLLGRQGAFVDPAAMPAQTPYGGWTRAWFVLGPDPVPWAQVRLVNTFGGFVVSRAAVVENPPEARLDSLTLVGAEQVVTGALAVGLVLLQIMLMVGPAIAVGARRNERLLAVVGASGGQPWHLGAVVLAGSAVVGLVASAGGALLGVGAAAVLVRLMDAAEPGSMPRVDVHLLDVLGLVVVGTLTAAAAAVLPARRVARLDVVAALTGRRAQTAPRTGVPVRGLVLAVAGTALAWWGAGWSVFAVVLAGIAVAEIGLILAASAVVSLLARLGTRAPLGTRFALRDAARHRSRTVPALAATIAAIAAGTAVLVVSASQEDLVRRSARQEVAVGTGYVRVLPAASGMSQLPVGPVDAALRATLGPVGSGLGYAVPYTSDTEGLKDVTVRLPDVCSARQGCATSSRPVRFVDPASAALVAPDGEQARAAVAAGKAIVWDRALLDADGTVTLNVAPYARDSAPVPYRMPAVLAEGTQKLSYVFVPRSVAAALDVTVVPDTLYLRPGPQVTPLDLARFDAALAAIDPTLSYAVGEPYERGADDLVYLLLAVLAGCAALAGTFIAVGLAAADALPDLGTLAAVGADPSVRRRVGAAQAAAITVPGALVGALAGLVAGAILIRSNSGGFYDDLERWRLVVPPGRTAALVLGVPLLAVALGWLTVRSRLDVVRRLGE